jgi:hypothetical protein
VLGQVRRLPGDEDARRAHVVPDVDEQDREVAGPPQQPREHDQPAHLGEQRRERLGAVAHDPVTTSATRSSTSTTAIIRNSFDRYRSPVYGSMSAVRTPNSGSMPTARRCSSAAAAARAALPRPAPAPLPLPRRRLGRAPLRARSRSPSSAVS